MSSPFTATYPTGGIPVNGVDIPASAVLLAIYLIFGITHAIFFFRHSKRKFIPQAMVMGFCFSRVVSLALRMAWTTHLGNKNVAIAANVFINAGVLLLYIVNLILLHHFTLQLFPSLPTHPTQPLNLTIRVYMFSIIPLLILVIVPGVQLFLTTDLNTISRDRTILRFAQVYLTVFVGVQIPWIVGVWIWDFVARRRCGSRGRIERGPGDPPLELEKGELPSSDVNGNKLSTNTNTKLPTNITSPISLAPSEITIRATIILLVALLLTWIQALKIVQSFYTPNPTAATNPPWFLRKPALYAGLFVPEVVVVVVYAVGGIRWRFLRPDRGGSGEKEGMGIEGKGNEGGNGG